MLFKDELCIENILVLEKLYDVTKIGRNNVITPNQDVTYKDIKEFTKKYGKIPMEYLGQLFQTIIENEDLALKEKEAQKFIDDNPYTLEKPDDNRYTNYIIKNYIIPVTTDPNCIEFTINLYEYNAFLEEVTNALNYKPFPKPGNMLYEDVNLFNFLRTMYERLLTIKNIVEN